MYETMYKTPEGFELHKPLIFPDVRDFSELFEDVRPWNFEAMNHKNGYPQAKTPENITREGFEREVSHFCAVRQMRGKSLHVTPTALLLDRIFDEDSNNFAFFDRVSFEAIYHPNRDRVLIVAQASGILASRYVAYIDPRTVPGVEW